ncbi:hypothetical protein KEM52_005257 [Ascosphaera acerosa]|nr:hypothetical protein KEM52_005257 [Ascosphaera acerosa]
MASSLPNSEGDVMIERLLASGADVNAKTSLGQGRSPLNATDNDGMTALHHAIAEGNGDVAVMLLKEGAETDKENIDGERAIDLAPDQKVRDYIVESARREGIDL